MDSIDSVQTNKSQKPFFIAGSIILGILIVGIIWLWNAKPQSPSVSGGTLIAGEAQTKTGSFNLSADTVTAKVGQPVVINITGDSAGKQVVGFDAVVGYDQTTFTTGQVTSEVAGYTASSNSSKGVLDVSVSKTPQVQSPAVFSASPVLSFTLTPQKAGTYKVELLEMSGKSTTKFVDSNTVKYFPAVNSVTVTVN